jgi:hypothetical protein
VARRHKNPIDVVSLATLAAVGVGVYFVYKLFMAPGSAGDSATSWLANLFPGTSPTVVPQGSVALPSGAVVPVSSLTLVGAPGASGPMTMTDGTTNYTITAGATAGSYVATPLSGLPFKGGLR